MTWYEIVTWAMAFFGVGTIVKGVFTHGLSYFKIRTVNENALNMKNLASSHNEMLTALKETTQELIVYQKSYVNERESSNKKIQLLEAYMDCVGEHLKRCGLNDVEIQRHHAMISEYIKKYRNV